jgi:ribosomal protein S18 acetylase RimI-like enzyme
VKGLAVIQYRTFRNFDPPALVQLWNQCFSNRGATILRGTMLIEFFLFAKPYFDPQGLHLAFDGTQPIGFALAGFGPNADGSRLDPSTGVLCALGVIPDRRRQGVGTELLRQAEEYLRQRGAASLVAGPMSPRNPFTFGIYGGSDSPGFLDSDPLARPFLEKHGYRVQGTMVVMHRPATQKLTLADGRFAAHRQQYDIHNRYLPATNWWQECVLGPIDAVEYLLVDRTTGKAVARAVLWEMETFRPRWDDHAVGVLGLEVAPELRRQGLGKFLLSKILLHLQEQYFTLIEWQVPESNILGLEMARQFGFQPVDAGRHYVRSG